jgi:hypothetical protein
MFTWEPDGWNFSDSGVKLHVYEDDDSDSNSSSCAEISGDDQLLKNVKTKYKKLDKEELLPE